MVGVYYIVGEWNLEQSRIKLKEGFRPTIEGTRITVQHVVEYRRIYGWDEARIAEAFGLSLAQVHAALAYYYEHQYEIDAALSADRAKDNGWLSLAL